MDENNIRYLVEHKILPQLFYGLKDKFVYALAIKEDALYGLVQSVYDENNIENPYTKEQFKIDCFTIFDFMCNKITFPSPKKEPQCYYAYMFFDEEFNHMSYVTIEKGTDSSYMCLWDGNGDHVNNGSLSLDDESYDFYAIKTHIEYHNIEV